MAVIEFSTEGIIIDANENFLRTMGYTLDEIKDKHHSMFCLPDVVRSMEYDNFWIDLRAGKSKSGLFRRIAKGGKDIYLEANYIPILDVNGRVYKIIKFANDITTRHYELMDLKNTIYAANRSMAIIEFRPDLQMISQLDIMSLWILKILYMLQIALFFFYLQMISQLDIMSLWILKILYMLQIALWLLLNLDQMAL